MKNKKEELIKLRNQRKHEANEARRKLRLELIELRKKQRILKEEESRARSDINAQNKKDRAEVRRQNLENKKIIGEKIATLNDRKTIIHEQRTKLREQINLEKTKNRQKILAFKNYKRERLNSIKAEKQDFLQNKNLEQKVLISELAEKKIEFEKELLAKKTKAKTKRLKKIKEIEKEKEALEKSKIELLGIKNEKLKERRLKRVQKLEKIKSDREELRIAKNELKDKALANKYKDNTIINEAKLKANEEINIATEKTEIIQNKLLEDEHQEELIKIEKETKDIESQSKDKIIEKDQNYFEDDFKMAFEEEDEYSLDSLDDNEIIKAVIINSYGKIGARLYKNAQKPANDKILNRLKKEPHIIDTINEFRKRVQEEEPSKFNKLVPFADGEKEYGKEFLNKFFSHAITTILMGKSLKFGNGYIYKYKIKNISVYKYSSSPRDDHAVEYIDESLGKKLNMLVAKKLKNKGIIQITEGLIVDASNGETKLLFNTNIMI